MKTIVPFVIPWVYISFLFSASAQELVFQETQTIGSLSNLSGALTDLDNDGDLDIYLSNYVGPSQIWFNDGQGFFTPGELFGTSLTNRVTVADFDGNGFQDAILPSNGFPTRIWFNQGQGLFAMGNQSMPQTTGEAVAGDFDGDGDVDLFQGWITPIENSVAFNDGTGAFSTPNGTVSSAVRSIAVGDMDGDGDLDAFVSRGSIANPVGDLVLFNQGNGDFKIQDPIGLGDSYGTDVELADIDGDQDLDAFVTNLSYAGSSPADKVWINDGFGNFVDSGQLLGNEDSVHVEIADVDGDGDVDAAVIGLDQKQRLWINDGFGGFTQSIVVSQYSDASQSFLGDIDGDGDCDMMIVAFAGTRVLKNITLEDLSPSTLTVTRGTHVSGDIGDLQSSDNVDFSIQRSLADIQSRTEIEFGAISPVGNLESLDVTLESSVFARAQVQQTIELFDFLAGSWEQIDARAAARFSDNTVNVSLSGDVARFVESGTRCLKARVRYQSTDARQRFSSNIDRFKWTYGQ